MPKEDYELETGKVLETYLSQLSKGPESKDPELIKGYAELCLRMRELADFLRELYSTDLDGAYRPFKEEDLGRLLQLYMQFGAATLQLINLNAYNDLLQKAPDNAFCKIVATLSEMTGRDYQKLETVTIENDGGEPIAELLKRAGSRNIKADLSKFPSVGEVSNKRYLMNLGTKTVVNNHEIRKNRKGFFTVERIFGEVPEKTKQAGEEAFLTALKRLKITDSEMQTKLTLDFHSLMNEMVYKNTDCQCTEAFLDVFYLQWRQCKELKHISAYYPWDLINISSSDSEKLEAKQFIQVMKYFENKLSDRNSSVYRAFSSMMLEADQYYLVQRAEKNSSITGRNVAMSHVADLLGMPDIIARAEFETLEDGDRKIRGVFMEEARGVDMFHMLPDNPQLRNVNAETLVDNPRFIKSAAKLQVLDYICGNTDRHQNNLMYVLNKEGTEFEGVVGIDNDMSFGMHIQSNDTMLRAGNNGGLFNIEPDQISFIPEETANQILLTTPHMLYYALQSTGLTMAEIRAAINRLQVIQTRIQEKKLTVLSDREIVGDWCSVRYNCTTGSKRLSAEKPESVERITQIGKKSGIPLRTDHTLFHQFKILTPNTGKHMSAKEQFDVFRTRMQAYVVNKISQPKENASPMERYEYEEKKEHALKPWEYKDGKFKRAEVTEETEVVELKEIPEVQIKLDDLDAALETYILLFSRHHDEKQADPQYEDMLNQMYRLKGMLDTYRQDKPFPAVKKIRDQIFKVKESTAFYKEELYNRQFDGKITEEESDEIDGLVFAIENATEIYAMSYETADEIIERAPEEWKERFAIEEKAHEAYGDALSIKEITKEDGTKELVCGISVSEGTGEEKLVSEFKVNGPDGSELRFGTEGYQEVIARGTAAELYLRGYAEGRFERPENRYLGQMLAAYSMSVSLKNAAKTGESALGLRLRDIHVNGYEACVGRLMETYNMKLLREHFDRKAAAAFLEKGDPKESTKDILAELKRLDTIKETGVLPDAVL